MAVNFAIFKYFAVSSSGHYFSKTFLSLTPFESAKQMWIGTYFNRDDIASRGCREPTVAPGVLWFKCLGVMP